MPPSPRRLSAAAAVLLCFVSVLPAAAQRGPAPPAPLVASVVYDLEAGLFTVRGFDFGSGKPAVSLAGRRTEVVSAGDGVFVGRMSPLPPGNYLLSVSWSDGPAAALYVTPPVPAVPVGVPASFIARGLGPARASALPSPADVPDSSGPRSDASEADHALPGQNTAAGDRALGSLTGGVSNSAFGFQALAELRFASSNSAFGRRALRLFSSGTGNTALGSNALSLGTQFSGNTAVGTYALERVGSGQNTGVGFNAFKGLASGTGNTALGYHAGLRLVSGGGNLFLGANAGSRNTAGDDNLYLAAPGVPGESRVIRIGVDGVHIKTYIAGEVVGDFNVVPVYQP